MVYVPESNKPGTQALVCPTLRQSGRRESAQRALPAEDPICLIGMVAADRAAGSKAPSVRVPDAPAKWRLHFFPRDPGIPKIGLTIPPPLDWVPMPRIPYAPDCSNPGMPPEAGQVG